MFISTAYAIQTKKSDYVPEIEAVEDPVIKEILKDLITTMQSIRIDAYKDFDEVFRDFSSGITFGQSNVAANQTAVALSIVGQSGNTEVVMAEDGYVMGISVASNDARTGGTLTVDATVNGTAQSIQAILDSTNTTYHYSSVDRQTKTFSKGDRIGVDITTNASWAPTTADIIVNVFITFN